MLMRKPNVIYVRKLLVPKPRWAYEIPTVVKHPTFEPRVADDGNAIMLKDEAGVVDEADCHFSELMDGLSKMFWFIFSQRLPLPPKGESALHSAGSGSPFRESEGSKGGINIFKMELFYSIAKVTNFYSSVLIPAHHFSRFFSD